MKVLIVDDDTHLSKLFEAIEGVEVVTTQEEFIVRPLKGFHPSPTITGFQKTSRRRGQRRSKGRR